MHFGTDDDLDRYVGPNNAYVHHRKGYIAMSLCLTVISVYMLTRCQRDRKHARRGAQCRRSQARCGGRRRKCGRAMSCRARRRSGTVSPCSFVLPWPPQWPCAQPFLHAAEAGSRSVVRRGCSVLVGNNRGSQTICGMSWIRNNNQCTADQSLSLNLLLLILNVTLFFKIASSTQAD